MSAADADPVLELDALLDSARLATAWELAHQRAATAQETAAQEAAAQEAAAQEAAAQEAELGPDGATGAAEGASAPESALAPAAPPPLPLALAHRRLFDELERTQAASPRFAATAGRVLAVPLAQLTDAIAADKLDAGAAEAMLDDLEDLLQALLAAAGWPAGGEE
jgi:hypothetical protein